MSARTLLNACLTAGSQASWVSTSRPSKLVVMNLAGSGATATVTIDGSLDGGTIYQTLDTITLTTAASIKSWEDANCNYSSIRANLTTITGTGANVSAKLRAL